MMLWFLVAMAVFFLEVPVLSAARASEMKAVDWGWNGVMFATLGVAALIAVAGMVFALIAIVRRRERSWMLGLPLLLGVLVVWFGIGEALGHEDPGSSNGTETPTGTAPTSTAATNGHFNVMFANVAPGTVRVSFDYAYNQNPQGKVITAVTVSPLGNNQQPLAGYDPVVRPISPGSGHVDVALTFSQEQLALLKGFSVCFTGPGQPDLGCSMTGYGPN